MMRLPNTGWMLSIVVSVVGLGLIVSHWREKHQIASIPAHSLRPVSTNKVDWYNPPPKDFLGSDQVVELPHHLFVPVSNTLREDAVLLLGDAVFVALTPEQAARYSSNTDPNAVLQSSIEEKMQSLRYLRQYPLDEAAILKREGVRELGRQKESRQYALDHLNSEIEQLERWQHQVKPYLVKGVALQAGGSFGGRINSDDILIYYGAMGSSAAPMVKVPVIAFLPRKPSRVYTEVGMME